MPRKRSCLRSQLDDSSSDNDDSFILFEKVNGSSVTTRTWRQASSDWCIVRLLLQVPTSGSSLSHASSGYPMRLLATTQVPAATRPRHLQQHSTMNFAGGKYQQRQDQGAGDKTQVPAATRPRRGGRCARAGCEPVKVLCLVLVISDNA
jgi:hypothetical protein